VSAALGINAIDAGRQRLSDGLDGPIFGDECHSGIALNVTEPRLRDPRGISLQRAVIALRDARAVCPAMLGRQAVHIRLVVVEDDDDVPGRGLRRCPALANHGACSGHHYYRDRDGEGEAFHKCHPSKRKSIH